MLNRKLSVLITSADLNIGGEQLSTIGLAEGLVDRGHSVFYMASGGSLEEDVKARGIKFVWGPTHGRTPHGVLRGAYHMRRFLKKHPIDIIQAAAPFPTVMAYLATRALNARKPLLIWHNRGVKTTTYPIVGRLFNYMIDHVVSISDYEKDKLVLNGFDEKKVSRVYHGVFLKKHISEENVDSQEVKISLGIDPDAPVVGLVSRLSREKGHCYLIDATPRILSAFPQAKIVFVGGGFMEDKLRAQVKRMDLERDILFLGYRRDLPKIYQAIDVLVHPSLWESLCNVLLEAMFMAKPIVATRGSAIPEVIEHGETGLLFPPGNHQAIAEYVIKLLKDRELANKLGRAAKKRAGSYFTIERQMDEIEGIYSNLLASRNRK